MQCKICLSKSIFYLSTKVLGKYNANYYKCPVCQFIQTEEPYWLAESYSSAISKLDVGLIYRNESVVPAVKAIINRWFNPDARFVDYGGGYGMLVRMMRDQGFDFYRQDIYCENLYAESFDITEQLPFHAELITAFEVFEHLDDPIGDVSKMLNLGDTILFTTSIQPFDNVTPESWWYFVPETGQHISLHSRKSLQYLANKFGLNYYWNKYDMHLFTPKKINNTIFNLITHPRWVHLYNKLNGGRQTFINKDFSTIRDRLAHKLSSENA